MGHLQHLTLPRSKKWRAVVASLEGGDALSEIAELAARAAEQDLRRSTSDPLFQLVTRLLVDLPHRARSPSYHDFMADLGLSQRDLSSLPALLAGLDKAISERARNSKLVTDAGNLARRSLVSVLSQQVSDRLPSLFVPEPAEIRRALASLSSGESFAKLARGFFADLTYRSLDYYLSREFAAHTGTDRRFANDADRTRFQQDLARLTFEASKTVEDYAGGWYGKHVWQRQDADPAAIERFAAYAFKKMRDELGRRRAET